MSACPTSAASSSLDQLAPFATVSGGSGGTNSTNGTSGTDGTDGTDGTAKDPATIIPDPKIKSAIIAGAGVGGFGLAALLGYVVYRRIRKPIPRPITNPSPSSSTHKPDQDSSDTTGRSVSDDMLFGPPAHIDPSGWNRAPLASLHVPTQLRSLPPSPPAPESVVDTRIQVILGGRGRDDQTAEQEHEPLFLGPAPATLACPRQ
ncbi:hypothetical protein BCR44DRAFT_345201 [Catenaria anguillulae PL171]|uniref:Uncharacterized protein n=1 Tax=Catenaria anguillulae PL171 TaxID=765915 RepID=A0A1Y2I283_9FUNG|nr:hypothetical protein BCR44DRAFT_345201 [Catenaria anguillulae PL171]